MDTKFKKMSDAIKRNNWRVLPAGKNRLLQRAYRERFELNVCSETTILDRNGFFSKAIFTCPGEHYGQKDLVGVLIKVYFYISRGTFSVKMVQVNWEF